MILIGSMLSINQHILYASFCQIDPSTTTSPVSTAYEDLSALNGYAQFFSNNNVEAPMPEWFNELTPQARAALQNQNYGLHFQNLQDFTSGSAILNPDGSLMNEYVIGGDIPNSIQSLLDKGIFKEPTFETAYYKNGQLDTSSPFFPGNSAAGDQQNLSPSVRTPSSTETAETNTAYENSKFLIKSMLDVLKREQQRNIQEAAELSRKQQGQ